MNRRIIALLLAVPLVLTGCGGDDEPEPTPTVTVTAEPEPAPTVTVTAKPVVQAPPECITALDAAERLRQAAGPAFEGGSALADLVTEAYSAGQMDATLGGEAGAEALVPQASAIADSLTTGAQEYAEATEQYLALADECRNGGV